MPIMEQLSLALGITLLGVIQLANPIIRRQSKILTGESSTISAELEVSRTGLHRSPMTVG